MNKVSNLSIEDRKNKLSQKLKEITIKEASGSVIEVKTKSGSTKALQIDYNVKLFGIPVNGFFMHKELLLLAVGVGKGCPNAVNGSLWFLKEKEAGVIFCGNNLSNDFKEEGFKIV